jgi:hypothetical protein
MRRTAPWAGRITPSRWHGPPGWSINSRLSSALRTLFASNLNIFATHPTLIQVFFEKAFTSNILALAQQVRISADHHTRRSQHPLVRTVLWLGNNHEEAERLADLDEASQ